MIYVKKGDIFNCPAQAIVNPVNTVGIMGKGLAFEFKRRFPDNYKAYYRAYAMGELDIGKLVIFERKWKHGTPKYIINFPTKKHWKDGSRLEYIQAGLNTLVREIVRFEIKSIAIPALGCGLGGLKWNVVYELVKDAFMFSGDVDIYLFEPESMLLS